MQIHFKSYADLSIDINKNLNKMAGDWDLVVGIPRSGMIPAYMISLAMNVNCTDISAWINNFPLKKGVTRELKKNITHPWEAKKVLLVDDSILSGESLKKELECMPDWLRERVTTLAVYSNKPIRKDVDIILEFTPLPRIFEWNIFHHKIVEGACISLEGVIMTEKNRDNSVMVPRYLPSGTINTIVSCRQEAQRKEVTTWLEKHSIKFSNLVMMGDRDVFNVLDKVSSAKFKAEKFMQSSAYLYIESEAEQAGIINQASNMPVYCQMESHIYNPGASLDYNELKRVGKSVIWKIVNFRSRI
ncbi:phosphoribosyltransferase family protein [Halomonas sp. Bachu 37]|uniref:phosphoribosyltransferase family protein n=1 Tax=Halomonas kashgarensis TaxID=3084920 RepID=UPI003217AAD7